MKMYDRINGYRKEYVYEQYTRIVRGFKDYEKISKTKMLDAIYKVYDNPENIIDICTTRELKYLKMVLENKLTLEDLLKNPGKLEIKYLDDKYDWERKTLCQKFLLEYDHYKESHIPEEMIDKVKQALKKVNWTEKKKIDELNELLVSYCKMQGSALLDTVCQFASGVTNIDSEVIWNYMLNNKLFNYYVFIEGKNIDGLGENIPLAVYQDYCGIEDELEEQRKKQGIAGSCKFDLKRYKTLFYHDFDIHNPKIKKFLNELEKLPFFWQSAIKIIKDYAMLNIDRASLKESIQSVPALEHTNLTNFFKTLDEAMDEMPSGALNGLTPNEAKEIKVKEINLKMNKTKKYVKQQNACLSKKEAKLFYKIYFGLLEFTNKKYKINSHIKIYNHNGINPYEIRDIVDKYWENKEKITKEFCLDNPYKFNQEELSIANEFKKGIRSIFIISKYELEYTAFMERDRIYMVKGINDNIDNIIPYNELPHIVMTSVIPFKKVLVYDGMLLELSIKMGNEFDELIDKEYDSMIKYYHL